MIKFEETEVVGWRHVIRGARNPMNSWDLSDSIFSKYNHDGTFSMFDTRGNDLPPCSIVKFGQVHEDNTTGLLYEIGPKDHKLMMSLAKGGPVHAKYRRMITVYVDITAPLYWWKEFDVYKVGTVSNSCSTMHKIHAKEFTLEDFSCEDLWHVDHSIDDYISDHVNKNESYWAVQNPLHVMNIIIGTLNYYREQYLKTEEKKDWKQMIQLLPTSYNQKRTIMMNYEVLANIYHSRKNHKLDEWHKLCEWIESLPYSEIITRYKPVYEEVNNNNDATEL